MKPKRISNYVEREYDFVEITLRKLFKIPNEEMILDCYWDKQLNVLKIKTLK